MSVANKLLRAAAGNASKAVYVDDVFSTFLYQGTGSSLAINNGVDLDGEGGLIWSKRRDSTARTHILVDSVRGATKVLNSDGAYAEYTMSNMPSSFNSNGYTIGTSDAGVNNSGDSYVSWTFRKAKKFFDIVTYTGNGTAGHAVSHNLGSVPGMILIKNLTGESWLVYHRGIGNTKSLTLNTTAAEDTSIAYFNNTDPTSTHFTLGTVGSGGVNNENGVSYIAYLFAHNDGDGEYGEDGDQDIIKCGSYTGTGSYSSPPVINLGFEPQWVMIKNAT
jgi:phage-related tail fiber protein